MAAFLLIKVRYPFNRQVVGFGRTRGPNNLPRIGIDQLGDLVASILNRFFRLPAVLVGAGGRIPESALHRQTLGHGSHHARINRGGGQIV